VVLRTVFLKALRNANAVIFQLRAWTDRDEEWAQLRSDLSVAVNDALVMSHENSSPSSMPSAPVAILMTL
jgi:hypothetical protein